MEPFAPNVANEPRARGAGNGVGFMVNVDLVNEVTLANQLLSCFRAECAFSATSHAILLDLVGNP